MHFILMNKEKAVANIKVSQDFSCVHLEEIYDLEYLPLHVRFSDIPDEHFSHWFMHRSMPLSRDGLANFLKHTDCSCPLEVALKGRCLSLTDHYWVKNESESVRWDQVNLFDNAYSEHIGNIIVGTEDNLIINYRSPDITTNGWLKKAWRRDDNGRDYLFKLGSAPFYQEPINEVFCSELMKKFCKLDFVEYSLGTINGSYCSICENFVTAQEEFVPAYEIYRTMEKPFYDEPYKFLIERCKVYGIKGVTEFLDIMLAFDYLIGNTDRHMGNFGFMRDVDSRKFTRIAPLFDNGTSLWNELPDLQQSEIMDDKPVRDWQEGQIRLIKNVELLNLNDVKDMSDRLHDLLKKYNTDSKRIDQICQKYDERWKTLNAMVYRKIEKKKQKKYERDMEFIQI